MKPALALFCIAALSGLAAAAEPSLTAADLEHQLDTLTLDPDGAYRVRDLRLTRGGVDIFLTEGVLMLARPVGGRRIAAVFTTADTEAGDAEILLLSGQPSERASLAAFTGRPNLDEHFHSALLFFADNTLNEINAQVAQSPLRPAPNVVTNMAAQANLVLQQQPAQVRIAMVRALLDAHKPEEGPFLATIVGQQLGAFNLLYFPQSFEPMTIGRIETDAAAGAGFRVWTGFRPRRAAPYVPPLPAVHDYHLDVAIDPKLKMQTTARFSYVANEQNGRIIELNLSPRLRVDAASVNGVPAEVVQSSTAAGVSPFELDANFLLAVPEALQAGKSYEVEIRYSGSVIHQVSGTSYFVGDRALWYPRSAPMLTNFDMVFHYPEQFRLVSTGDLAGEEKQENGTRVAHRRTSIPEQIAGFNLGEYTRLQFDSGPYHIDCYADSSARRDMNGIPAETAGILDAYTRRWMALPIHSLAVTPIPGYFGQGFPGLIYLSNMAYVRRQDRPAELRNPTSDIFFSDLLLPHEIAHQWWGNIVSSLNYRSAWIMEAMANDSAVQFIQERDGATAANQILESFRDDLLQEKDGKTLESLGPLNLGDRLLDNNGELAWHAVIYEKGAWVLHMLRERLGAEQFRAMQLYILKNNNGHGISNDDLRDAARQFLRPGDPDPTLKKFFETWVEGTGVPRLQLEHAGRGSKEVTVRVSGVDDEFTAELPLHCKSPDGSAKTHWMPIVSGDNPVGRLNGLSGCELPSETEFLRQH